MTHGHRSARSKPRFRFLICEKRESWKNEISRIQHFNLGHPRGDTRREQPPRATYPKINFVPLFSFWWEGATARIAKRSSLSAMPAKSGSLEAAPPQSYPASAAIVLAGPQRRCSCSPRRAACSGGPPFSFIPPGLTFPCRSTGGGGPKAGGTYIPPGPPPAMNDIRCPLAPKKARQPFS